MKKNGFTIQRICIFAGVSLLVGALVVLALWRWNVSSSEKQAQYYVNTLQALMPEPQNAVPEERRDNTMSVLSVDGCGNDWLLDVYIQSAVGSTSDGRYEVYDGIYDARDDALLV